MKFKSGYLGVLLVTLCLFGSALLCIIANVDKEDQIATRYDYVTDVTGLFEFTDTPQYTEYNPIENYIGYSDPNDGAVNPSGIDFVSSTAVNNYAIMVKPSTTTNSLTGLINQSTTTIAQATFSSTPVISIHAGDPSIVNSTAVGARLYDFKVSTVYDWVKTFWPGFTESDQLKIDVSSTAGAPNKRALFCYDPYTAPGTGELTLRIIGSDTDAVQSITINPDDYTATYSCTLSNGTPYSQTTSMYESWICYGDARQRENYFTNEGGSLGAGESYYNTTLALSYSSKITTGAEYEYMIPSGGVTLADNSAVWSNGEDNGIITIIVDGGPFSAASPGGLRIVAGSTIDLVKTDTWTITASYSGESETVDAGAYRQLAITIDAINDTISIRPVSFTNFVDYTIIDTVLGTLPLSGVANEIRQLTFRESIGEYDTLRWSIGSTTVLMDTYGAVMVDPSLNIGTYWPNMNYYRLWFQSFALYGDSMTINGQTYNVIDESITIADSATYSIIENYAYINGAAYPVTGGSVVIADRTYNVTNNLITINATYPVVDDKVTIDGIDYTVVNDSLIYQGVTYPVVNDTVTIREIYPVLNNSVTVDGVTYPVTGRTVTYNGTSYAITNGQVTIPGIIEKTYKLKNFYVSFPVDNHVYLTFVESGDSVDLGEKISDVVSFGGVWYFSAGLYEGSETLETVYNWAVGWDASPDTFILISLGLLAAGVVVIRKVRGLRMGVIDWLAVVLAVIALLGCIGGF